MNSEGLTPEIIKLLNILITLTDEERGLRESQSKFNAKFKSGEWKSDLFEKKMAATNKAILSIEKERIEVYGRLVEQEELHPELEEKIRTIRKEIRKAR